jgi:hypothetical protein
VVVISKPVQKQKRNNNTHVDKQHKNTEHTKQKETHTKQENNHKTNITKHGTSN